MLDKHRPSIDPKREEYVLKCMRTGDYETMELEQEPEYELIEVLVFFDFTPYEPMTRHYPGCDAQLDITEVIRDDNYEEICLLPEVKAAWEEQLMDDYLYRLEHDPRW
jgi:hypothetical protein